MEVKRRLLHDWKKTEKKETGSAFEDLDWTYNRVGSPYEFGKPYRSRNMERETGQANVSSA